MNWTLVLSIALALSASGTAADRRVSVTVDSSAHAEPLTGRVYVAFAREAGRRTPIRQAGSTGAPLYGKNVEGLRPGDAVVFDGDDFGHPVASLNDLPNGTYHVQPFVNVYTRFERKDGHVVWVHEDQGEGQNWRRSPGNLFGDPVEVELGPDSVIGLVCDRVIDPIDPPADTEMVKRFRMKSPMLSDWWGANVFFGATVLLPKGFDDHPDARYPIVYQHGHFSTRAPGGFGRGREFDRFWLADETPRFLLATIQHPTPYYDDSYAVNSENNGPYGDALVKELMPEVERRFRAIGEPRARFLTGGSTGGWEALAQQVFYPEFFNGCWALCPDSVDFRAHQIVNVYEDDNAYWIEHGFTRVERPCRRRTDGNIVEMMKDENHYELVVGDRSRSGGQWDIWEATFSPVGDDGYPRRIWDKRTGAIDHEVAEFWRKNYDLRHILETEWERLGPMLAGKIHVYVGDMDNYYLNNGVKMLETFLASTRDPHFAGVVEYGDGEPHCWGPSLAELIPLMARRVESSRDE